MATKTKKTQAAEPKAAAVDVEAKVNEAVEGERKRLTLASLTGATLMHFAYHPERKILRANVQQDVYLGAKSERVGRDVDLQLADLTPALRKQVTSLFSAIAQHVGAIPLTASEA